MTPTSNSPADKASEAVKSLGDKVSETTSQLKDRVNELGRTAADKVEQGRTAGRQRARKHGLGDSSKRRKKNDGSRPLDCRQVKFVGGIP